MGKTEFTELADELRAFYIKAGNLFAQLNVRVDSLEKQMTHARKAMEALCDAIQEINHGKD
jgi:hypothetical protein